MPWLQRRTLHLRLAEALETAAGPRWRWRRTGSARATSRVPARRCCARRRVARRPRPPRRRPRRAPGARAVAAGDDARAAHRGARGVRRQRGAGRRARRGRPRHGARSATARPRGRGARRRPSAGSPPSATWGATVRRALAARRAAAEAFAAGGRPADAAIERLAIGDYMRNAPSTPPRSSWRAPPAARPSAAERLDLRARALGLEGVVDRAEAATSRAGSRRCRPGWRSRSSTGSRRSPPSSTSG